MCKGTQHLLNSIPLSETNYLSPVISNTYPTLQGNINRDEKAVNITYQMPVRLSTGNLTVWKLKEGPDGNRQTYPANTGMCSVANDSVTVSCTLLDYTLAEDG